MDVRKIFLPLCVQFHVIRPDSCILHINVFILGCSLPCAIIILFHSTKKIYIGLQIEAVCIRPVYFVKIILMGKDVNIALYTSINLFMYKY